MLPKQARFSRTTFPKKRPSKRLTFSWGAVSLFDTPRGVSVVVSKKVFSQAVKRNQLKRRLYNSISDVLSKNEPAVGVVVHPKREALTASSDILKNDLKKALGAL